MNGETPPDIAALRAGLLFASAARRPLIAARIAELTIAIPQERSGTAREAPSTRPSGIAVGPLTARSGAERAVASPVLPPLPDGDWRAARRLLRAAGHDVEQRGAGQVYVDGVRNHDPRLQP